MPLAKAARVSSSSDSESEASDGPDASPELLARGIEVFEDEACDLEDEDIVLRVSFGGEMYGRSW